MNENDLKGMLEEFEEAAKALRESLLERSTEQIWAALARQEQAVERLGAFRSDNSDAFAGMARRNPTIRQLLERCRNMLQTNRAMAGRFLDVIDQTLSRIAGGTAGAFPCYGAATRRSTPLLVRQQG